MSVEFFKRLGWFVVLCLVQVLILNHIHLFDVAIPLLYVYFTITFQRGTPKWMILLWSFALGLAIDVFSNTPGLASGSLTLIAVIQPYLLELFVPRDSSENLEVSVSALGLSKFVIFTAVLLVVYSLVFFALTTVQTLCTSSLLFTLLFTQRTTFFPVTLYSLLSIRH